MVPVSISVGGRTRTALPSVSTRMRNNIAPPAIVSLANTYEPSSGCMFWLRFRFFFFMSRAEAADAAIAAATGSMGPPPSIPSPEPDAPNPCLRCELLFLPALLLMHLSRCGA